MKQRLGKVGDKARHKANTAFLEGVPRQNLKGKLKSWVDRKYFKHDRNHVYYVHQNKLYIFSHERVLITCIPVPSKFKKEAQKKERRHRRRL